MKRSCNKLTETTNKAIRYAKSLIKKGVNNEEAINLAVEKYKNDDMLEILKLDGKIRYWRVK